MDPFQGIDYYDNLFPNMNLNIPRRLLRDAQDPYGIPEMQFKIRYRFSQETVKYYILPLIEDNLKKVNRRGLPIAPAMQILICLRFFATGSFQIVCGDLLNISQPSVSRIVATVSKLIAQLCSQFIKYPVDMISHRRRFYTLGQINNLPGLPDVDGAIDCTHIKIVHTPGVQHHEAYRNRKSFFSINTQAVVGPEGQFLDIVARWAGSTHDSRIFQMSSINLQYRDRHHTGILVGDNGYPSLPYLLTPFTNPSQIAEERYNKAHIKTRNIVERVFGIWKRRFPCLSRGLANKLETVSNIITACAVLHNISLLMRDTLPDEEILEQTYSDDIINITREGSTDGFTFRNVVVQRFAL